MAKFRITGPDGSTYEVTAPDDASEQDVLAYAQANFSPRSEANPQQRPERSMGVQGLRAAEMGARGFADSAIETLAAPLELSGRLTNMLGNNYQPGAWTQRAKDMWNSVGKTVSAPANAALNAAGVDMGGNAPENTFERGAYGAGRGAADAASMLIPATAVAKGAKAGTVAQKVGQALAAQPALQVGAGMAGGSVGEMTDNPLLGAATALAVPVAASIGARAITPVRNQLTPEMQRLANVAAEEGIPLTAGQKTGSKALQLTESVFNRLPMTSGTSEAAREAQRQAFNSAVLKRAGIDADNASPEVLAAAQKRLGDTFKTLSQRNTVKVDDEFRAALDALRAQYNKNLTPDIRVIVQNYVDDILANGDEIAGETYQKARSAMGRRAQNATDPELRTTMKALQKALDEAARRTIDPEDALAWDATRKQYEALKTIEKAMQSGTPTAVAGNIPPTQLQQAARQGRSDYARGGGELNDLARIGNAFVRDNVPDSGTAQRTLLQNLMTGMSGAGSAGFIGADPTGMAAAGAATLALPRALQAIYNSTPGQAYLTNQLLAAARPGAATAPVAIQQLKKRSLAAQLADGVPAQRR